MRQAKILTAVVLGLAGLLAGGDEAGAAEFHVSSAGTAEGTGSKEKPWDLATALAGPPAVEPGDVITVHGGTYRGGFESQLTGSPKQAITVRAAPGERVTIDTRPRDMRDSGALMLRGADTIYEGFEVTCSDPVRETKIGGSWPEDIRRGSVEVRGHRLQVRHFVVHDLGSGFGFWSEGEGGLIGGCLVYYNGWKGPDRGHGHAIYAQNKSGTKRIVDNIMFQQFAYGLHVYGSKKASIDGFEIEGNIAFQNGCLTGPGALSSDMLVGGDCPSRRILVQHNMSSGGGVRIGYPWGPVNEDLVCRHNLFDGGLVVRDYRRATVSHNTVIAPSSVVRLEAAEKLLTAGHTWKDNTYYVTDGRWGELAVSEGGKGGGRTLKQWQEQTGFDEASTLTRGQPDQLRVLLRPSPWQAGRAHVGVFNPQQLPVVPLDLSTLLKPGQQYRIVSARNFYGPDVVSGTYNGQPVQLAMTAVPPAAPVGMTREILPAVEPAFGAFVVLPVKGSAQATGEPAEKAP